MSFGKRLVAYCYDVIDFVRQNIVRFVVCLFFVVLGVGVGVWYGVVVSSEVVFFFHFNNKIILVISGGTSFIKYMFFLGIECIIIVGMFFVLSLNYYATFLHFLIFLYKGYVVAFNTVVLIAATKLSGMPFLLLCYLPISFIMIFLLILVSLKTSAEACRAFNTKCPMCFSESFSELFPILLLILILSFLESILTFMLTSSIIIS